MRTLLAVAILVAVSIFPTSGQAQTRIYGSAYIGGGGAATLYSISPTTGVATAIGPIGFNQVGSLDFSPSGQLFGVSGSNLILIDLTTGAGTLVGALGVGGPVQDIAFRGDGTLFAYIAGNIYTVNTTTGAATLVGATGGGFPDGNGLAFKGNILLLGNDGAGGPNGALWTINQATGVETVAVNLTYGAGFNTGNDPRPAGMKYDRSSGNLFAAIIEGHPGASFFLATIDPVTGAVRNVGATVAGLDALAVMPAVSVPALSNGSLAALIAMVLAIAFALAGRGAAPFRRKA